ncbi:NAD(P)-binding protein [Hypomontagnella monticulosa]|nr:NAD(P)-binding protein [Hypomontagnella monticulosa]
MSGWLSSLTSPRFWVGVLLFPLGLYAYLRFTQMLASPTRYKRVHPTAERVLILGASSGLGRMLARLYAARGAHVCIVSRREEQLSTLSKECGEKCFWVAADFSNVGDMVRVRQEIHNKWGGLDSLYVCAGVSAVQPVMRLAGVAPGEDHDADSAGIQEAMDVAARATEGNIYGPFLAAVSFIPMLMRTSASPSILLVSSVAAVIPAPTRALYAATKASSLLLFQSLAIEHPTIAFTFILPATLKGNFRASAVDADPATREAGPNQDGLQLDYVAFRCMDAMDYQQRGNIIMPSFPYAIAHHLYYLWPSYIEKQARRKYNFG